MASCDQADGHDTKNCCVSCHEEDENDGTYMCDGFDAQGKHLHVCCKASVASHTARDARRRKAPQ
jgi:hypothetical protein